MPFRIENILKKDGNCNSYKKPPEKEKEERRTHCIQPASILQQTLLNRLQPPYYRPVVENLSMRNLQPYPYDRLCYSPYFYNPYVINGYPYALPSPAISCGQYNAYSKRKGGQVRFTPNQTDILEKRFLSNKYLSPGDRKRLADNLKLSDRQVKTWFQNRRAKWRRSSSTSGSEISNDNEKTKEQNDLLNRMVSSQ